MPYLDVWVFCHSHTYKKTCKAENSTICMDFSVKLWNLVWNITLALPALRYKLLKQRFEEMMDYWVPAVFGAFKLIVLGTCMFLAIKSHRDGARKEKEKKKEMEGRQ